MKVIFLSDTAHPNSTGSIFKKLLDENNDDELAGIKNKISHVADRGGHPSPPYAKSLRAVGGELNELRCKYIEHNLIRIYYFIDKEKKTMVLLNTTIKPDGARKASKYEGKNKKVLDKEIEKDIQLAMTIKSKYPISSHEYEPLDL